MTMTQKLSLFALAFFMASGASAAEKSKYSCGNVGDTEEWTLYVDLNKQLAGFFDNDTTSVVPLKEIKFFESLPPQTVYVFEGEDMGGGPNAKLRITFNKTKLSGQVTLHLGQSDENTQDSLWGCKPNEDFELSE